MSGMRNVGGARSKKGLRGAHLDAGVRFVGILNICDNAEEKGGI